MSGIGAPRAATTVALWAAAWQGGASADEVLAAIDDAGHRAGVRAASTEIADATGLPGPGWPSAGSSALLPLLRRGGRAELLLPRPGDMRGLPVGGDIAVAALDAGAVVRLPALGIGLVPSDGQWRAFRCDVEHPAPSLAEAHDLLDAEVGMATRSITALDVARSSPHARERVRQMMLDEAVTCPPGIPAAASALLATSISLHALLSVANGQDTAAVTSHELAVVDDALRPLAAAVGEARRAAVAAAVAALSEGAARVRTRVPRPDRQVSRRRSG